MNQPTRKRYGAYYTAESVVHSLVRWAVAKETDRLLDPSCGDGRFLVAHPNSVGVEKDEIAASLAHRRAPGSLVHQGDFFSWASETVQRFECAAGNPPFIRYQRFTGAVRSTAISLCQRNGADFSALSSSWAPFIVATATLLMPGGRMSFVVPAEIGHAPYAAPLLQYLVDHFAKVQIVAVQEKLFPELSEDCWLLHAVDYGGKTSELIFSVLNRFQYMEAPPVQGVRVSISDWQSFGRRLRPFLMPSKVRELYRETAGCPSSKKLGDVARVGIGYVTGANNFFHLRPSEAKKAQIPERLLLPAVRNGRILSGRAVTSAHIAEWKQRDEPVLLLDLSRVRSMPSGVQRYLETPDGRAAKETYKCRNRNPWYVVPDITVPDAFLSYMSNETPALVANQARCVGTNSVHLVNLMGNMTLGKLISSWDHPLTKLSCEIEGHPLGGGMLKVEPGEAKRVLLGGPCVHSQIDLLLINEGIDIMRKWRHFPSELKRSQEYKV